MVGSSVLRYLKKKRKKLKLFVKNRKELDLTDQKKTRTYLNQIKPDLVVIAAAKVGGIYANQNFPVEFSYENTMIASNLIKGSYDTGVKRLIYLGSSCIYPKDSPIPIKEEYLLKKSLEPTNEAYAISKIFGLKLCQYFNNQYGTDYRCLMPTNLFGLFDTYHPLNSHVIPSLIERMHKAKVDGSPYMKVWGTGSPKREFLYTEDLARAIYKIMFISKKKYYSNLTPLTNFYNVGSGYDISIKKLVKILKEVIQYKGDIIFDKSKPDGVKRKLMDSSKIFNLGWMPKYNLKTALDYTYIDYLKNFEKHN